MRTSPHYKKYMGYKHPHIQGKLRISVIAEPDLFSVNTVFFLKLSLFQQQ